MRSGKIILWTATAFIFVFSVREVWQEVTSKKHQLEVLEESVKVWEVPLASSEAAFERKLAQFDEEIEENGNRAGELATQKQLHEVLSEINRVLDTSTIDTAPVRVNKVLKSIKVSPFYRNKDVVNSLLLPKDRIVHISSTLAFSETFLKAHIQYSLGEELLELHSQWLNQCLCHYLERYFIFPEKSLFAYDEPVSLKVILGFDWISRSNIIPVTKSSFGRMKPDIKSDLVSVEQSLPFEEVLKLKGKPLPYQYYLYIPAEDLAIEREAYIDYFIVE